MDTNSGRNTNMPKNFEKSDDEAKSEDVVIKYILGLVYTLQNAITTSDKVVGSKLRTNEPEGLTTVELTPICLDISANLSSGSTQFM